MAAMGDGTSRHTSNPGIGGNGAMAVVMTGPTISTDRTTAAVLASTSSLTTTSSLRPDECPLAAVMASELVRGDRGLYL